MNELGLHVPYFEDVDRWDWRLTDPSGALLAYHEVALDRSDRCFGGFLSLHRYLRANIDPARRMESEKELVEEVGRWIAEHVLGDIGTHVAQAAQQGPVVVRVLLTPEAWGLTHRPIELAQVGDAPLMLQDVSFAFEPAGATDDPLTVSGDRLRMLAIFSVPTDGSELDLRRERYELRRIIRDIALARQKAIELRILQYGATREVVERVLREQDGWDIVHFSGHGEAGALVLESEGGTRDPVSTEDVVQLLWPGRQRLKLVSLTACDSAAATAADLLRELGIEAPQGDPGEQNGDGVLPAVAHGLVQKLGCAVVAMRYPVADDFAIALGAELYVCLLEQENALPRALQFALRHTARQAARLHIPAHSIVAPTLLGHRARSLRFTVPDGEPVGFRGQIPDFPEEPVQLLGRVGPLARASKALEARTDKVGVLFCGMAGAGKSACALELAYRHQERRFPWMAWYAAPAQGTDTHTALGEFAAALERQLPDLEMVHAVEDPKRLGRFLPVLKAYLESRSVLIVLDNIESLLTGRGTWQDDRWLQVVETLSSHHGPSRVVLTSRQEPAGLSSRIVQEAISALSLNESVLLARQLEHLGALMESGGDGGRELVVRTLRLVQGNPKLILLADGQAADRDGLKRRLEDAERAWAERGGGLEEFFEGGESRFDPEDFLSVLKEWTRGAAANLDDGPRVLFQCICALQEEDRLESILADRLPRLWQRLEATGQVPQLADAIGPLLRQGLVERDGDRLRVHPAVAEAGQESASRQLREAVDVELAGYWKEAFWTALSAAEERGAEILQAGMRAAPYLLDARDWETAVALLEQVIARDTSQRTLALLVPLLERVVEHVGDTPEAIEARTVLAKALTHTRPATAQSMLEELLPRAVSVEDFELASGIAGELINLLRRAGRLEAALKLAEDKSQYSKQAGLGPWTRLVDDGWRLQLLQAAGRDDAVIDEARELLDAMETLVPESRDDEAVTHWYAREAILDAARSAASAQGHWGPALGFGAEVLASKERRQASHLSKMRTRFNDYYPLIRLDRIVETSRLLDDCRECFTAERYRRGQGQLSSAFAHLAHARGEDVEAIRAERVALRDKYAADSPESIAISHHNLGCYLGSEGGAHLLAAAAIRFRTDDRWFGASLAMVAAAPRVPRSFGDLCAALGNVEGVDLAAIWGTLPAHGSGSDEAVRAVLDLVGDRSAGSQERLDRTPHANQIRVWVRQGRTNGWILRHIDPARASA